MKYPMGWETPLKASANIIDAGVCPITNEPMEIVALNMFDSEGNKTKTYIKVNVNSRVALPLTNEELTRVLESTQANSGTFGNPRPAAEAPQAFDRFRAYGQTPEKECSPAVHRTQPTGETSPGPSQVQQLIDMWFSK